MSSPTPIYQQLVEEQGDVLNDTRQTADALRRKAEQTLGRPVAPAPEQQPGPAAPPPAAPPAPPVRTTHPHATTPPTQPGAVAPGQTPNSRTAPPAAPGPRPHTLADAQAQEQPPAAAPGPADERPEHAAES
ncbi:hypothetical protein ACFY1V_04460 [Streptomyces sp. NPDC001255]|uniref:hypothetical protein n=1 Tax=Streptomyces sp. NPDC001255 TaxID=3364550 RepID=UPI0036C307AC